MITKERCVELLIKFGWFKDSGVDQERYIFIPPDSFYSNRVITFDEDVMYFGNSVWPRLRYDSIDEEMFKKIIG
jgi:hypothetical protein